MKDHLKKLLALLILIPSIAFASGETNEVITAFDEQSLPVLNQTIRKLQEDIKTVESEITTFTPSSSNALSGSVIQALYTESGAVATGSSTTPNDDTIPQVSEMTAVAALTTTITPTNASNYLEIESTLNITDSLTSLAFGAIFQDAGTSALTVASIRAASGDPQVMVLRKRMVAGTTSATTFKVYIGENTGGTITINGTGGARLYGGVNLSSISVKEIKA